VPDRIPEDKKKFQKRRRRRILKGAVLYAAALAGIDALMLRAWRGSWRVLAVLMLAAALALACLVLYAVLSFGDRKLKAFAAESNALIEAYQDSHNGRALYDGLVHMKNEPQTFQQEIMWYFNLAVALCAQKKTEDALDILLALAPLAEGEEKKLVDAYIRQIRDNEQFEKHLTQS
jgi:hypothetical protein